jgi:transcription initiation factor TFIID TATA-box-binding protein
MQATYEPELFPAAMFKRGNVHFTCFCNGTILVTGIKTQRMMEDVVMTTLMELEVLCQ